MKNFNLFTKHFGKEYSLADLAVIVRELWDIPGIYIIFIKFPDRVSWYLGVSKNIGERIQTHIREANKGSKGIPYLYSSLRAHGVENFSFTTVKLHFPFTRKALVRLEVRLILKFQPSLNVQNRLSNGQLSEETKAKMSLAHIWKIVSQETRDKISTTLKSSPSVNRKQVILVPIDGTAAIKFDSGTACANFLNISSAAVSIAIKNNSIVQKKYRIY